ncbi:peptide-binding protein [Clostridium acetobutylicum]|nr:peptide-binding protein [Clostridium acetobutylicum]
MRKSKLTFIATFLILLFLSMPYKAHAASQTPITRADAEQRALTMINLNWTYSKAKNGVLPSAYSGSITAPSQFRGIENVVATGIPYCWGGFDGLNSSSYGESWTSFTDAVNKGAFVGNVKSSSYGHIPGTAGLDCSGFVQATFNIKDYKLSTSTIFNQYFTKIDIKDIKHMDILNLPGNHVVIFDKWGTRNGVNGAYTYEATPDTTYGGIQGTKQYFMSMNTVSQYIPGRYVNIKEVAYVQVINASSLNIRTGPSTSYPIIGTISQNQIAEVTGYSSDGTWYKIKINGIEGYASSTYLTYVNN